MSDLAKLTGPKVLPASGGPARQLVVLLHGVGADGDDLISLADYWSALLPDAEFVSPNAPDQCDMSPYGYQWFSLLDRSMAAMTAGVKKAAPVVNAYIDDALAERGLTPDKLALVGFSQGTMTSLYVALRRPEPVAAVLGYSGALLAPELLASEIKSRPPVHAGPWRCRSGRAASGASGRTVDPASRGRPGGCGSASRLWPWDRPGRAYPRRLLP